MVQDSVTPIVSKILGRVWSSYNYAHFTYFVFVVVGIFSFDHVSLNMRCPSILNLIYTMMTLSRDKKLQLFVRSRDMNEAPMPVYILYPISRDNVVHSLLHLARSTIRKYVRFDHIDGLILPSVLKGYLKDSQYLYEDSDSPPPVCDTSLIPPPPPTMRPSRPPPLPCRRNSMI